MVRNIQTTMTRRWQRINQEQFKAEGRGLHGKWQALSPAYKRQKDRKFPGKTILRRTDRLFRAATTGTGSSNTASLFGGVINYHYFINVPYSKYHQQSRFAPHPPTRRIFDANLQQQRGVTAALARTIVDGLFSREFFDNRRRGAIGLIVKNTGFDSVSF